MDDYTKWLGFTPTTVDTTTSTSGRKWAQTQATQAVGAIASTLVIPAYSFPATAMKLYARLLGQFDYTAGQNFTITRFNRVLFSTIPFGFICIRYRIGSAVVRYLMADATLGVQAPPINDFPLYTGQVIKPNFCFELWAIAGSFNKTVHLDAPISMDTSILSIPSPISQTAGAVISPSGGNIPFSGMRNNLPWAMPQAFNANSVWLSN